MPSLLFFIISTEIINFLCIMLILSSWKRTSPAIKVAGLHVCLLLLSNSSATYMALNGINNYFILHMLIFFDLILVFGFYHLSIKFKKKSFRVLFFSFLLLLGYCALDSAILSTIEFANKTSIILSGTFKIILAIIFFTTRLNELGEDISRPKREAEMGAIFSASLLIYASGSMIYFLFLDYMMKNDLWRGLTYVHLLVYLFAQLLMLIGLFRYYFVNHEK